MVNNNLSELLMYDKHCREYFYSLPQAVQSELSDAGSTIRNTVELHACARNAEKRIRDSILAARNTDNVYSVTYGE